MPTMAEECQYVLGTHNPAETILVAGKYRVPFKKVSHHMVNEVSITLDKIGRREIGR